MLATCLQVCHLLLQSLNASINGIYNELNLLREEGLRNLLQMVQQELHCKANPEKLLDRGPPLQNPLGGHGVNKVMLNIVHHTPQQLEEVLPRRSAKKEPLYKVSMAVIDRLQVGNTLPRNPEAMKSARPRSLTLGWSNRVKKATASLAGSGIVAELLPILKREDGATSMGVGPREKQEIWHEGWTT